MMSRFCQSGGEVLLFSRDTRDGHSFRRSRHGKFKSLCYHQAAALAQKCTNTSSAASCQFCRRPSNLRRNVRTRNQKGVQCIRGLQSKG